MGRNIQPATRLQSLAKHVLLASAIILPAVAQAQSGSKLIVERIHSTLPLYTFDWKQMWPRSFTDDDGFGCESLVPSGDWQFVPDKADEYGEEAWHRFESYGVFHCAASLRNADTRADLEGAPHHYGFFVRLGKARLGSIEWELWALQIGMIPRSSYTLIAREAAKKGRIEDFVVLQQRCPSGSILEAKGLNVWTTRYCAINTRDDLLSLARRMLKLAPIGTIRRIAPPD